MKYIFLFSILVSLVLAAPQYGYGNNNGYGYVNYPNYGYYPAQQQQQRPQQPPQPPNNQIPQVLGSIFSGVSSIIGAAGKLPTLPPSATTAASPFQHDFVKNYDWDELRKRLEIRMRKC